MPLHWNPKPLNLAENPFAEYFWARGHREVTGRRKRKARAEFEKARRRRVAMKALEFLKGSLKWFYKGFRIFYEVL